MKEKGEKPRPIVIIAQLKKQGVEVSSPQVSMVLKRMGFRPRKRRGAEAGGGKVQRPVGGRGGLISVEDLIAAKRLVSNFGTADFKATYTISRAWMASFGIDNLFDRRQPSNYSSTGAVQDPPGRFVYLSGLYRF
jgi:outer membrane receptor protein involved in Fe transport